MGERWFLSLLLLTLLAVTAGCGRSDAEDATKEPSRKKHIVQRGEFVYFTLAGSDFKIPKKYSAGGAEQFGRLTDAKLRALLPEFEGYEPEKNAEQFRYEFSQRGGWGRSFYANLTERGRYMAFPFGWARQENESIYGPMYGRDGVYDEMRYGLEYYSNTKSTDEGRNEYFIYRPNGIPLVSITCRPYNPSPGCELKWAYNERLNGEMDFGMEYLPQWHEIWSKTNSLFENGTTTGFDEAAWQARVKKAFGRDYYQWKATLPNLQSCAPEDCPERFQVRVSPPGYDHRLYVRLLQRPPRTKSFPELLQNSLEKRTGLFISVGDEYDEIRYGLEFHRGKLMGLRKDGSKSLFDDAFHDDIYFRRSELGPDVIFSCYSEKNKEAKRPTMVAEGCVGQWALPSNDVMYAAFSREYLPMWQEIVSWASRQGMRSEEHMAEAAQGE